MTDDPNFVVIPGHLFRLNLNNSALVVAGRINRLIQTGELPKNVITMNRLQTDLGLSKWSAKVAVQYLLNCGIIERDKDSRSFSYKWKGINK